MCLDVLGASVRERSSGGGGAGRIWRVLRACACGARGPGGTRGPRDTCSPRGPCCPSRSCCACWACCKYFVMIKGLWNFQVHFLYFFLTFSWCYSKYSYQYFLQMQQTDLFSVVVVVVTSCYTKEIYLPYVYTHCFCFLFPLSVRRRGLCSPVGIYKQMM